MRRTVSQSLRLALIFLTALAAFTAAATGIILVDGAAFGASEVGDIYFDTAALALAATDPTGAFPLPV